MVLGDLPLAIFEYVHEGVPTLDLGASGTHGEFVDASVLSPVGTDEDASAFDLASQRVNTETKNEN
jgi:hypothetical protein